MYAVIKSGGKQYRVQEGQTLKLEKLEVPTGETLEFDQVLLVGIIRLLFIRAQLIRVSMLKASMETPLAKVLKS